MAQNKTTQTESSVPDFIAGIADQKKREDFKTMVDLIAKHTQLEPKMWGTAIVGFGIYHYKYDSGREGTAPLTGVSPRSSSIAIYVLSTFENREALLAKFGKHKTSGGCIHIKKLEDIDRDILIEMVKRSIVKVKQDHPG